MKTIWMYAGLICFSAAATAGAMPPKPVAKPMVLASDPNTVMQALTAAGYTPTLAKDPTGDPSILYKDATGEYRVWFQSCENHLNCKALQLYCEWGGAALVTPQKLNDEWAVAFATPVIMYVNKADGRLAASSYLLTDPGGISQELFIAFAKKWQTGVQAAGQKFTTPAK